MLILFNTLFLVNILLLNKCSIAKINDENFSEFKSLLYNNGTEMHNKHPTDSFDDSEIIEVKASSTSHSSTQQSTTKVYRHNRQLSDVETLHDPQPENNECFTFNGLRGSCMSYNFCEVYTRNKRQLAATLTFQWSDPPFLPVNICTFFDKYGRMNKGICCATNFITNNDIPLQSIEVVKNSSNSNVELEKLNLFSDLNFRDSFESSLNENSIRYDTGNAVPYLSSNRYQWPLQTIGQLSNPNQWPPPLPTHPPFTINWPPPIPTHPPGHHYPTHPSSHPTTRPTSSTTFLTTKRTTTTPSTTRRTSIATTTRRSSYPSYPNYPTYRPTTSPIFTTTTRRPTVAPPPATGPSSHDLPLQCGIKNPISPDQERIVGGINASPHEFPWIAVLFKSGKQFCGGSIITNNHILTAAHCVARMNSWDVASLTAHIADYNIRTDFEVKHQVRRIKRLVRHKGFDFSTLHNDIAILTLNEPVKFSYEVQPICLPISTAQQGRSYSGQLATVAGWGSLRENGPQPSILQKVQIPIWANIECARKYGRAAPGGIIESMICAGQASKDSCSGDSGGPLIVNENGRYVQVGIVSWGIGCGKGQYPGVYTRTTSLLPWIYKNIK